MSPSAKQKNDLISHLLNEEERFLLVFRKLSNINSSFEFMKIWREFDADGNGILDSTELQAFLRKLLAKTAVPVTEEKIQEFSTLIDHNGVIENEEFEGFVKDLLDLANKNYESKDLDEFKDLLLKQWDENSDGKI
ncbi:hypothetical protein ACTXT7_004178, partial [Hymenolepis weldensis]